ncbi:protein PHOTOPERIOD-INDEPENDENT EARLY FLOWERING 1-like [Populus alba]|uniref:protein PHOTOPERIOD-INDEPENDENT EARLY FLOWERING 1-like n=1 Tax=Populus alba TaxID=43335 RepID=UPI00158C98A5|nr:protein PHOTOPERIOD-INDEPENDENT EARLY FLOWERING 1-like [Populus alba]
MAMALLAHLACGKGIWGPRLIVVPTGVKLDWETEFLKWCPAFKILAYLGSANGRGFKSLQDEEMKFLMLDETHLIKKLEVSEMSDLVELRPLMYFLMPHIFQSHQEFKGWFSNSR